MRRTIINQTEYRCFDINTEIPVKTKRDEDAGIRFCTLSRENDVSDIGIRVFRQKNESDIMPPFIVDNKSCEHFCKQFRIGSTIIIFHSDLQYHTSDNKYINALKSVKLHIIQHANNMHRQYSL